jgi:hypothetical protein
MNADRAKSKLLLHFRKAMVGYRHIINTMDRHCIHPPSNPRKLRGGSFMKKFVMICVFAIAALGMAYVFTPTATSCQHPEAWPTYSGGTVYCDWSPGCPPCDGDVCRF